MPVIDMTVAVSGPLIEGRGVAVTDELVDACQRSVAKEALTEVHIALDRSIRNPTPYYETQIIEELQGDDRVVHDRRIVYGPWLEGVSRRNQTTRFKGYRSFRRASQAVEARIPAIVEKDVRIAVGELGGG